MKALTDPRGATIYEVADAGGRVHRHRLPGPARHRAGRRRAPGHGCWTRWTSLNFTPSRLGRSLAERHARGQRHRLPRPVRSLLRRGRARLRRGRRRGRPQRAHPVDARSARRPARWSLDLACAGRRDRRARAHRRTTTCIADLVGKGPAGRGDRARGGRRRRLGQRRERSAAPRRWAPTWPTTATATSRSSATPRLHRHHAALDRPAARAAGSRHQARAAGALLVRRARRPGRGHRRC